MNKEPIISFIIPFYNREDTLQRCIDSILKDSSGIYEIILVDDASTDNSATICGEYAGRYPYIKYLKTEKNKGPGNARNMGIDAASGKYLYFLDSDDEIDAAILPKLAEVIEREEPNFIYIRHLIVLPSGEMRKKGPKIPKGNTSVESFLENYPDVPSGPAWICVYKSQFLRDKGIRFEQTYYYEDCCFLTSAFINAKSFYMLPEFFNTHYAFHTNSLNTMSNIDRELEGFQRYFELCHRLGESAKSNVLIRALEMCKTRLIINIMRNCTKPIFIEELNTLENQNVPEDSLASYEFYKKHGVKSFLAQWLRNLYSRMYVAKSVKQVYLCPVTDFSIAVGTLFASWSRGNIRFLDNNPADTNYYVKLCRDNGFEVSNVTDASHIDGKILLYHKSYVVDVAISKQLDAMSLKEGEDYISVYS